MVTFNMEESDDNPSSQESTNKIGVASYPLDTEENSNTTNYASTNARCKCTKHHCANTSDNETLANKVRGIQRDTLSKTRLNARQYNLNRLTGKS